MTAILLLAAAYLAVGAFFAGMSYGSMAVDDQIRDRYPYGPAAAVASSLIAWPVLAVLLIRCIQASVKASRSRTKNASRPLSTIRVNCPCGATPWAICTEWDDSGSTWQTERHDSPAGAPCPLIEVRKHARPMTLDQLSDYERERIAGHARDLSTRLKESER